MSVVQNYGSLVQERIASGYCPFCHESEDTYIDSNNTMMVLASRSPYHSDHILICSKDHVVSITDLTDMQRHDMNILLDKWTKAIQQKYSDYVVFLREGSVLGTTGKTVSHLHRHIVPHFTIQFGNSQENSDRRTFLDDKEYHDMIDRIRTYG